MYKDNFQMETGVIEQTFLLDLFKKLLIFLKKVNHI